MNLIPYAGLSFPVSDLFIVLRKYFYEIPELVFKIIQHKSGNIARCIGVMFGNHFFHLAGIFFIQRIQVDHFRIAKRSKLSFHIIYISDSSAHACCKIAVRYLRESPRGRRSYIHIHDRRPLPLRHLRLNFARQNVHRLFPG